MEKPSSGGEQLAKTPETLLTNIPVEDSAKEESGAAVADEDQPLPRGRFTLVFM